MSKPIPYDPALPVRAQVAASFASSLRNLRTSYLDSCVLHGPLDTLPETLEAWAALGALQDAGQVRAIGVSNVYDVQTLEALESVRKVEVVQNRWYEKIDWNKEVVRYCREKGIMFQSFWTLTGSPTLLKHNSVLALAEATGSTTAQIIFRLAQTHGVTPLAGSKTEEHMRDGVEAEKIDLNGDALKSHTEILEKLLF